MSQTALIDTHLDVDTSRRLRAVIGGLARRLHTTQASAEAGLTPTRSSLLLLIERRGPIRLSEVGDLEGLNPTMLSRSVSKLVDDGLVQRTADDGDRRAAWVSATEDGRTLAAGMRRQRTDIVNAGIEGLTSEHRQLLRDAIPALEALSEQLKEQRR